MSSSWHWFIVVLSVANILACVWLIVWSARQGDTSKGDMETLDHTWDGDLCERNNPLPRWWLFLFIGTIIWGFGYLAWYPGLGTFKGIGNWSQTGQYLAERERVDAVYQAKFAKLASLEFGNLSANTEAMEIAHRLYGANCATCHGADARGARGFPNLADGDWLWGGDPASITQTITNGRVAAMPGWGPALGEDGVNATIAFVKSLSGLDHDAQLATQGQTHYNMMCIACHGPDGKGMAVLGAPNLTDDIWLYGRTDEALTQTITHGRNGNMPAHSQLLSPDEIKLLVAYVLNVSDTAPASDTGQ